MKLTEVLNNLEYKLISGDLNREVNGIVINSQQIREGNLFVAIPGTQHDGIEYINDAVNRGATVIVTESAGKYLKQHKVTFIQVPDAHYAAGILSANFNHNPSDKFQVIGITGTNGKTTTAFLIRAIMQYAGKRTGMIGTVKYETGKREIPADRTTPNPAAMQSLLAEMANNQCDTAIIEVSSHSIDQKRIAGINFNVGIFTNLTSDHLNYHKTIESYFETKANFIKSLGHEAFAILNTEDSFSNSLIKNPEVKCHILTYGLSDSADIRADIQELGFNGAKFKMYIGTNSYSVKTHLTGEYNILNILAATAAAYVSGVDPKLIVKTINRSIYIPGRLEEIKNNRGIKIFVDYAHTEDALHNVLSCLKDIAEQNIITVFGCGGNRDKSKRALMGKTATEFSNKTVITNDNPRTENPNQIIADILAGIPDNASIQIEPDREKAIKLAIESAKPGDIVLIAGKGHEKYQDFGNRIIPFDDRITAAKYAYNDEDK